ncbi:tyrosine-type recombinase/integrase [Hyphomicrobium sp.]|uniref:tyrosine-type recombinase/integrase n=1 Tax=Hyphomicrobium sp. TaxID=82 RepID=UPI0025C1F67E|nr:tyrosine-type recombinase/integrase [Hyphomicrobium sp.]MCC7253041.1 tyrosine-type recombinase/integrase [Hyphomicrobium sp.]
MSRYGEPAQPRKVNGYWYLVRRVPAEYAKLDRREKVAMTTRIRIADDPRGVAARKVVARLDAELRLYWKDLKAGRNPEGVQRHQWAQETARRFGCEYVEEAALQEQLAELIKRMETLELLSPVDQRAARPALLGEVDSPKTGTKVTEMLATYESILGASLLRKSPAQMKRWRTTRETALGVLVGIAGKSKLVRELTHDDAFALRDYWNKRVLAGEVLIDSANKQIGYVAAMFREINDFQRLKMEDIFHRKTIRGGEKRQRESMDAEHIQNVLLAPGAMDKLNDQARGIFYVVAELGLRPSEVCGLDESTIHVDAEIPFVQLTEEGRELKTANSVRDVPLVGVALEVMKAFPKGFPHYRDKADVLSAAVNKHLKKNSLLQREGQSFYSLRHAFKDRLRDAGVKDELVDILMGHATGKEKYGRGYLLKMKHDVLTQIAFKAPAVSFGQGRGLRGPGRRLDCDGQALPQEPGMAKLGRRGRRKAVAPRLPAPVQVALG